MSLLRDCSKLFCFIKPMRSIMGVRHYVRSVNMCAIFDVDTAQDFEMRVKHSEKPVIVDFHAGWCAPCKLLAPRLENIVGEKGGEICLAKVDIDEHSELALYYKVGAVPSLLVMQNGKVLNRMEGLQTTDAIRDWINQAVKSRKMVRRVEEDDDEDTEYS
ncbi:thioredoxin, mitochondrial-like [Scaptodrosophila lebanonensis]|uniref:Thioredoxin, mitochondrial-like n=1 Tax=Drosophila lebanonensis TaxID=7225 RepID=A0A6J2U3R6_DROLE|nr:thioredoxin, mitochondrial-like [Scaptodrosophila lebanonensis]